MPKIASTKSGIAIFLVLAMGKVRKTITMPKERWMSRIVQVSKGRNGCHRWMRDSATAVREAIMAAILGSTNLLLLA
ncbi:MAG: hypothetical protein DDT25_00390 [Chloroflexi bacterium]|nr:hypothetical protein [Chloroflexota bacterium]